MRQQWTKQPQIRVRLDRSHPSAIGIVDGGIPHLGHTLSDYPRVVSGTTVTLEPGTPGMAARLASGGTGYWQYSNPRTQISGAMTFMCLYQLTATGTAGRIAGNFTSAVRGYGFLPSATNFRGAFASGAGNILMSGNAVSTAVQCDHIVYSGTQGSYYQQGKLVSGPTTGTYTAPGTSEYMRVGADNFGQAAAPAKVYLWLVWNRALSATEIEEISSNPWQLFEPLSGPVWMPASGATTHTTTGALVAGSAAVAGTAVHIGVHPSTGALAAGSAVVAGTANNFTVHATSGTLAAQAAAVVGSSDHTSGAVTHASTGTLQAQDAVVSGTALRNTAHATSGALVAQVAVLHGEAQNGDVPEEPTGSGGSNKRRRKRHTYGYQLPEQAALIIETVAEDQVERNAAHKESEKQLVGELIEAFVDAGVKFEEAYQVALADVRNALVTREIQIIYRKKEKEKQEEEEFLLL